MLSLSRLVNSGFASINTAPISPLALIINRSISLIIEDKNTERRKNLILSPFVDQASLSRSNFSFQTSNQFQRNVIGAKRLSNKKKIQLINDKNICDRFVESLEVGAMQFSNSVVERDYLKAINDLNCLQSNSQVLALSKYKKPEEILPLFAKQLQLANISIEDLNKLNVIHVTGTKGKGSTCTFLENILLSQGHLKVACFNSPHLIHVTERIRINGKSIDRVLFTKYFNHVYAMLKDGTSREGLAMPSYFAFLTILSFHIFLNEQVDCAIIEVGIGGEFDPTNIVRKPVACAITTLDLDHTNILGKTIESIAWTKAGIIKPSVPIFTIKHEHSEATKMIQSRAIDKSSPLYICQPINSSYISRLGIKGPAQVINASIACQLAKYLLNHLKPVPENTIHNTPHLAQLIQVSTDYEHLPDSFKNGLSGSSLPGRCQVVDCTNATYFLDGAHTKKSMENCLEWFIKTSSIENPKARKILMININGERDKSEVLRPLLSIYKEFDLIIFTSNRIASLKMSLDAENLETSFKMKERSLERGFENVLNNVKAWRELVHDQDDISEVENHVEIKPTITDALEAIHARNCSISNIEKPHILVTGSLIFVGAIMETIASDSSNEWDEL